jgi:antitoxin component YwqK of YwqJK toxin-antitoxin module
MKITIFLLLLGFSFSSQANTLFEQLCIFNPNWSKYKQHVPIENERVFLSDKQYIQTHLELVLQVLKTSDLKYLNEDQLIMRKHLTEVLEDYRLQGVFPINYYRAERIPVFIDEHNTHCAVGYLMKESGYGNLALQISKEDNYVWVKDLKDEQVSKWQQLSGFTLEELKLIQGAYDSYMPFAIEAPNRIEIPQKPEVIAMSFKPKDLIHSKNKTGKYKFWIRGEGKDGILHGRWEQNYSPALPWIVGFYQSGKREGKWLEYYQGTDQLCRTEYWKDDKLNGIRTRFNREGNVIEEILFQDGNAVVKTNYELNQSIKYVRKPIGNNIVWTEIYDMGGILIASGHESVHNPGNLQWFQNIELTALNTMSLSSQTMMQSTEISRTGSDLGQGFGSVRLYSEPPLVEYIKQGDWVYYKDDTNIEVINLTTAQAFQMDRFFRGRFRRLGGEILPDTKLLQAPEHLPQFDSLHVNFTDGNANWWNGYYQEERVRMEFEWFTSDYLSMATIYNPYGHQRFNALSQLKSYGFVNELDEKINKWVHFDMYGQLSKIEEFIQPQKKNPMEIADAEERRAQNQLPFTAGK